jgi:hypothetical protein
MGVSPLLALALALGFVSVGQTGARYDARAHKLEARGAAAADLRAPSAQIARVRAERTARSRAEQRLRAALAELGAPADKIDELLASAAISDEQFGSDGSVQLMLTVLTSGLDLKQP